MSLSPLASRALTLTAAAFLGFDGILIAGLGFWASRPGLVVVGIVFFLSSGLVLLYGRWHHRQLEEIAAARRALREEAEQLRKLLDR